MQAWYKSITKRVIPFSFLFLLLISVSFALEDCNSVNYIEDTPCLILKRYVGDCSGLNVSVFNESDKLYEQTMINYSPNKCQATLLEQTSAGTRALLYSNGDTGTILIKEGYIRLYTYITLFIIAFALLLIGYYYENPHIHFLVGVLLPIMALDIFVNGFPQVSDVFMTNSISIILTGIGMYYLVSPYLIWLKNNEGGM